MDNIFDLLKNFKNIQESINQVQQKMKSIVVTGTSGGEMIKIDMNCAFEPLKITIAPEAIDQQDIHMLEDLILAALNNAISNVKEQVKENAGPLAGGLNTPFGPTGV